MATAPSMHRFRKGQRITRDGTDEHVVIAVIDDITIEVECVVAPTTGWCKVGERDTNLARRYEPRTIEAAT